ncbi:hypothetical protein [Streptomyces sp. NPDC090080]|uniref:hypothetical protein n=1 Tax=Streptomyces sp. NPDC090080 TaxID=3365939 RepID=UPI0037FB71CF
MNELLALAVEAHGGLERWNSFNLLRSEVSIGGAIWEFKQRPGLLTGKIFEINTHRQKLSITPFIRTGLRSVFTADRLALEDANGIAIEEHDNPERLFTGHEYETPWSEFHVAYFASEALWTYLTSPFLYTYPGFHTEEIEPWGENGEEWRRLKVTFPDWLKSHTTTQITYFGPDGLMRRHDYTVDILSGATGANYTLDYEEVEGIKMPMRRRIYAYDSSGQKVPDPLLVSIDFGSLAFT